MNTSRKRKRIELSNKSKPEVHSSSSKKRHLSKGAEKQKSTRNRKDSTNTTKLHTEILVGSHISIAGGFCSAIDDAQRIGCTTMQIFTKSGRQWKGKEIPPEEAKEFREKLEHSNLSQIMAHASYLINLGGNEEVRRKSIEALKDELNRCNLLNIPYLVLHPGAHLGAGEEVGMKLITEALDEVLDSVPGPSMILLENTAGQGTCVGYKFEHLKTMLELSKYGKTSRLGICLDTCHTFAAGYDISTKETYEETMKQFEKIVGFHYLKAIHLNDSKTALGARVDRHEKIGKGKLKLTVFQCIMNDSRLSHIPKVLETPAEDLSDYETEIKLLKGMILN